MHSLILLLAVSVPGDELPIAREPAPVASEPKVNHAYRWVQSDNDTDQVHLYDGRTQMGTYRRASATYYVFDGKRWASMPSTLPKGAPKVPATQKGLNSTGHNLTMPVPDSECQP